MILEIYQYRVGKPQYLTFILFYMIKINSNIGI